MYDRTTALIFKIMEYLIIIAFQVLGIGFHVMQKIIKLGDERKSLTKKEIVDTFFSEDWDTLIVSVLIICGHLLTHYVIDEYTPSFRNDVNFYVLYAFGAAFMLGYLGQRMVYKWLGTAENKLDKMVQSKLQ